MAAQLDYNYSTPKGTPGEKFDISFDEVVTRKNQEEDGILKYGMAAQVGDLAGTAVKVPVSGATRAMIEGIVLRAANTEQDRKGHVVVRKNATVGILKKGNVWGRLASDAVPAYGGTAYVVVDGSEAGTFTSASAAASVYEVCEASTQDAKEVVADDTASPNAAQVKLSAVTPVASGYTPKVGDYVISRQVHGATVDIGATFGNASDGGIAVIELR